MFCSYTKYPDLMTKHHLSSTFGISKYQNITLADISPYISDRHLALQADRNR